MKNFSITELTAIASQIRDKIANCPEDEESALDELYFKYNEVLLEIELKTQGLFLQLEELGMNTNLSKAKQILK